MGQIKFSNGAIVNFEGTPTQQDIEEMSLHAMSMKPPEQKPGVLGSIGKDLSSRWSNIQNVADKYVAGEISRPEQTTSALGQIIGGGWDIATELAKPIAKAMVKQTPAGLVWQAYPEELKQAIKNKVGETLQPVAKGIEAIETQYQKIPERTRINLESAGNIVTLPYLGKLAGGTLKGISGISKEVGTGLKESGIVAADIAKKELALDIVRPIETKAVKEAQVARTTETGSGLLKRSVIAPTAAEQASAKEVAKIAGITAKNTAQQNYNIIKQEVANAAKQLESDIKANPFIISRKEVLSNLNNVASELSKSPLIVGDAEKMALRLIEGAKKIISENPGTGEGLLNARKKFDKWVLSQKPKAFDAKAENAFTIANRAVRNMMTDILDTKATSVGVRSSLKRQSALFNALENIAPKAAVEADTAIGRLLQRVTKIVGTKNKVVQGIAAAVGIGGLGAAATFAPAAAVAGIGSYIIYRGGKFILNPKIRILLGELLQKFGNVLDPKDIKIIESILKATKGKGGLSIEDVSKKGNPEARKYKSAEEFIKAQEKNVLQHASDNPNLTKFDDLTKVNKVYNDKLSEFKKLEAQRNNIKTRADIDNFDDKKWTALRDWLQSNEPPKVGGRGANAGDGIYLSSKTNLWRGAMEAEGKKLGKYDYDVLVTNPEKAKQYFQPSGGGQQLPETLIQHNEGIVLGKTGKYNLKKQLTDIWNKSQLPQEGVKQFSKSKIKSGMRDEVRSGLKSAISSLEKKMESASLPVYQKLSLKLETAKKALKRVEAKSFTIQQYHRLMEFIKLNK